MIEFIQNDKEDSDPLVKKRHVLLTLYLAFVLFVSLAGMGLYFTAIITGKDPISEALSINPPLFLGPEWLICVEILVCISDLVAISGIFKWRKWGFWLYACNSLVDLAAYSLHDGEIVDNIIYSGLSVLLLYGVLSAGRKNKAWPQLD